MTCAVKRGAALLVLATALYAAVLGASAAAAEKVALQLKWLPQAQFAGYYVAQSKGYYKAEGLEVTIKPGGPDILPARVISGQGADVIVSWMPDALAAREAGIPLVNIAQVFNQSGLTLTCRKSSGVRSPKDLKGKTLGLWYGGSELPFVNWMATLGYKLNSDVKIIKQGINVDPLLQEPGRLHLHHELQRVLAAGGCGPQGKRSRRLLLRKTGHRDARGRLVRSAGQAGGPCLCGAHEQVPQGQFQGLERRREEPGRSRQDRGRGGRLGRRQRKVCSNARCRASPSSSPPPARERSATSSPPPSSVPSRC